MLLLGATIRKSGAPAPALSQRAERRRPTNLSGMNDSEIFVKTPLGLEEVRSRALKLSQRLRTMQIGRAHV